MPWSYRFDWSVYGRIPDGFVEKYLARLALPRQEPSRPYLDQLTDTHMRVIPFENLDTVLWNRPVSLEPEKLTEKILLNRRGGYCFELNGLFCLLLKELGFQAWLCPCRQLRHGEPCPVPATHCVALVYLDGRTLFCDVGYGGPMPRRSIELKEDAVQKAGSETYYFQKSRIAPNELFCGWYDLLWRQSGGENGFTPLIQLAPVHMFLSDFYGANLLRSTGDTRYGTLHVYINTPDGSIDLTGPKLSVLSAETRTESVVTPDGLPQVLLEYFNIVI